MSKTEQVKNTLLRNLASKASIVKEEGSSGRGGAARRTGLMVPRTVSDAPRVGEGWGQGCPCRGSAQSGGRAILGENRKESRWVVLWRDGTEWRAGQGIHIGSKDHLRS